MDGNCRWNAYSWDCFGSRWHITGTKAALEQDNAGEYRADYDANKCVRLGDYKGIKVSLAVTDDDVQQEIDGLIQDNVTYEQKKGTVQEDDKIYAKFNGYIDGKR